MVQPAHATSSDAVPAATADPTQMRAAKIEAKQVETNVSTKAEAEEAMLHGTRRYSAEDSGQDI